MLDDFGLVEPERDKSRDGAIAVDRDSLVNERNYLQYGCGWSAPTGWHNFDASPTLRIERLPIVGRFVRRNATPFPNGVDYGDIVKGLPVENNSYDGVYCSHVLEHLSLEDLRTSLRNTRQIMRAGGSFRLVMPDLEYVAQRFLNSSSPDAALVFMRQTELGRERRARGVRSLAVSMLGNSSHLWMWDFKSIEAELREAGFVEIRRALHGDASDPRFSEVEDIDRWKDCLGVDCLKSK